MKNIENRIYTVKKIYLEKGELAFSNDKTKDKHPNIINIFT